MKYYDYNKKPANDRILLLSEKYLKLLSNSLAYLKELTYYYRTINVLANYNREDAWILLNDFSKEYWTQILMIEITHIAHYNTISDIELINSIYTFAIHLPVYICIKNGNYALKEKYNEDLKKYCFK